MKRIHLLSFLIAIILFLSGSIVFARMPDILKGMNIERKYFPSGYKKVGKMGRITGKGKVVILRKEINRAFYADEGDPVHEKDSIYTIGDCRARIEFKEGNLIIMSEDSALDIDKVYFSSKEGKKSALFHMWAGKIICYAVKLFRYPEVELTLKTKTAIVGVRGTKFGVEIISDKVKQSFLLERLIAGRGIHIAQSLHTGPVTRVYGIEGRVSVTSLVDGKSYLLKENEIISAGPGGLGRPIFNPDGVRRFLENIISPIVGPKEPASELPENITRERDIMTEDMERREDIENVKQMEIREPEIHHETPPPTPPTHGGSCSP